MHLAQNRPPTSHVALAQNHQSHHWTLDPIDQWYSFVAHAGSDLFRYMSNIADANKETFHGFMVWMFQHGFEQRHGGEPEVWPLLRRIPFALPKLPWDPSGVPGFGPDRGWRLSVKRH